MSYLIIMRHQDDRQVGEARTREAAAQIARREIEALRGSVFDIYEVADDTGVWTWREMITAQDDDMEGETHA